MVSLNLIYQDECYQYHTIDVEAENLPTYILKEKRWQTLKVYNLPTAFIKSKFCLISDGNSKWAVEKPTVIWNSITTDAFIYFSECNVLSGN